ncbi:unnamed protein product [Lactuca saligna]|uniref:Uncharacterized protein n=1 Tax=Lactuca saligna TaxID=75948 RepID=A0AA35YER8_LACSI|nr:unnamed protein product [Lactuca saligna]
MTTTLSFAFGKENPSDKFKCIMALIIESHTDTSHDNIGILDVDSLHTAKDLKSEWDDASVYQVKNHVNLSSIDNIEKDDMIDLLHFEEWIFEASQLKDWIVEGCIDNDSNEIEQSKSGLLPAIMFEGSQMESRFKVSSKLVVAQKASLFLHRCFFSRAYSPSEPILEHLSNDVHLVVPNVDQLISSQPISEDQLVVPKEAKSSNQEFSTHSNTNESSNPIIL